MMHNVLSRFDLPWIPCLALILFFAVFGSMLLWVFQRQRKPFYQYMESLPLEVTHERSE